MTSPPVLMLAEDSDRRKVVLLGDTQVGKTCITNSMRGLPFTNDIPPTIGVDYTSIERVVKGNKITFDIYDTAGQEKYHSVTLNSLRDSQYGLIVYDITDRKSFQDVEMWNEKLLDGCRNCVRYLIANKLDLEANRKVSKEEGEELAAKLGMNSFVEVSAKDGINMENLLKYMSNEVTPPKPTKKVEIKETPPKQSEQNQEEEQDQEDQKKKCCLLI